MEDDGLPNIVASDSEKGYIENQSMGEQVILSLKARLRENVLNFPLSL